MEISDTKTAITIDDGPSEYASSYQGTMEPSSEKTEKGTDSDVKIDLTDIESRNI